jgi:hypothetical protein
MLAEEVSFWPGLFYKISCRVLECRKKVHLLTFPATHECPNVFCVDGFMEALMSLITLSGRNRQTEVL